MGSSATSLGEITVSSNYTLAHRAAHHNNWAYQSGKACTLTHARESQESYNRMLKSVAHGDEPVAR